MILVTVGTEKFLFNRLMQWIDHLIKGGLLNPQEEEIIIQYGSCTFLPKEVSGYSILPTQDFFHYIKQARLIIAHCGEGTIDLLGRTNKPFILVPRSYRFGEHVDEHQLELAEIMEKRGVAIARSPGDLVRFIAAPKAVNLSVIPSDFYAVTCQALETQLRKSNINRTRSKPNSGMLISHFWQKISKNDIFSGLDRGIIQKKMP